MSLSIWDKKTKYSLILRMADDDSEILVIKTGPPTAKKRKVSYVYCD